MSAELAECRSPEQWCQELSERGLKVSPRTLRSKAREHRQYFLIGLLMLLSASHIEGILEAEASRSRSNG